MPGAVLAGLGSLLSMDVIHCVAALSPHIGSGLSWPLKSGRQVNSLVPSLRVLSLPSLPIAIMAALSDMCGGAALLAVLMGSSSDMPCTALFAFFPASAGIDPDS